MRVFDDKIKFYYIRQVCPNINCVSGDIFVPGKTFWKLLDKKALPYKLLKVKEEIYRSLQKRRTFLFLN